LRILVVLSGALLGSHHDSEEEDGEGDFLIPEADDGVPQTGDNDQHNESDTFWPTA
jgi:hypothetical protein